ncbi:hypothetical protein PR048_009862 [Dryococelus australis]|uniref:Integrase catalytic domain-containing protein n=1 Tax=Dryococelus australis TaxID=614101 RepID=A0ABQ9I149_9NEOP|nr:hypothetical protein PR048_009862 [Dryococelus australis]
MLHLKDPSCSLMHWSLQLNEYKAWECRMHEETCLGVRLVVSRSQQVEILRECHDSTSMCNTLSCNHRTTRGKSRATLVELPETELPFQRLGLYIIGPMPKTASGNRYILTIIDHFSRYLVMKPLPEETAETTA